MRKTFYTEGKDLFDPTGQRVILRGVNKMSVWDKKDPTGEVYFPEIRKTQANSVRIVWAIREDLKPEGAKTDLKTLDALITNARKNQLIPMIDLHDAIGDWKRLEELVDYWVQPEVVKLIQKHQAHLLVNIGNEVGDENVKVKQFIDGYKNAIQRMRKAGIHTPLVIDASDWGKKLDILNDSAGQLIKADPDKNLIFSVHMYWSKSAGANADFIQSKLQSAVEGKYPLIIGEFSKYGGYAGEDNDGQPRSICSEFGEIDYTTILKVSDKLDIGWYAWEWGPGNDAEDPTCTVMDMTSDGSFDQLKVGWPS
ncbi:MAG: cellulase family glycosylhydrolase, partial [Polynucleobacter sp.]|nr:cellulase family glycosylhydrolase [Polynucleobacter sp.]